MFGKVLKMKIKILIPVYNDWKSLFKVLDEIDNLDLNKEFKISVIIVNDASNHDLPDFQKNLENIDSIKILNMIKEKAKPNKKEISKDEAEKILKESQKQQLNQELKDQRKPEKKADVKKLADNKSNPKVKKTKTRRFIAYHRITLLVWRGFKSKLDIFI